MYGHKCRVTMSATHLEWVTSATSLIYHKARSTRLLSESLS